jgi:hypothetical protein
MLSVKHLLPTMNPQKRLGFVRVYGSEGSEVRDTANVSDADSRFMRVRVTH